MEKIKAFIRSMNEKGIPTPLLRDGSTGQASLSYTLVVISALNVQISLINMFAQVVKGVDVTNAIYWFGMCSALYFGRKISGNKSDVKIEDNSK